MAANAVLYKDPSKARARVRDLKIFYDTGFLLNLLGYQGDERRDLMRECISLAKTAGAKLRVFPHTIDECLAVLRGTSARLKSGRMTGGGYGGVYGYCLKHGTRPSEVDRWHYSFVKDLERLGVRQEEVDQSSFNPPYSEAELDRILEEEVGYREDTSRLRDVRSIAGICKLRGGSIPYDIGNAKAIFVTTNELLMKAGLLVFGAEDSFDRVPVVLTESLLTNILWLKSPQLGNSLPRHQVIAAIAAGMNVPDRVWGSWLRTVDKLETNGKVDEDELVLMRYSPVAQAEIMRLTHGREEEIGPDSAEEILERIKADIAGQAGYRLRQLQKGVVGPREKLERVIGILAKIPAVLLSAFVAGCLAYIGYGWTNNNPLSWVSFVAVTFLPTAAFYWVVARRMSCRVRRYLERNLLPPLELLGYDDNGGGLGLD